MTSNVAKQIHKISDVVDFGLGSKLDYGGNMLIKQDQQSQQNQDTLAATQTQDAVDAGTPQTKNATTRDATLQYAADSAGATRTGNDADSVSGTSVMTKKKAAARALGVA